MTTGAPEQTRVRTADEILALAGCDLGPSPWLEVSQRRVDAFARIVDDWHWAHNAPDTAGRGPFGSPIVHAHLTLSLTVHLFQTVLTFDTVAPGCSTATTGCGSRPWSWWGAGSGCTAGS